MRGCYFDLFPSVPDPPGPGQPPSTMNHHQSTIPNSPGPHPRPLSFPPTRVPPSWPAATPRPVARQMRELVPAPAKSSRDAESSLTLGTTTREASNHQQCGDEKPRRSAGILAGLAPSTKLSADHMAQPSPSPDAPCLEGSRCPRCVANGSLGSGRSQRLTDENFTTKAGKRSDAERHPHS
jgi:hypothetical protein